MEFLVVALVALSLLGVVNLVFSFGVIRRLREHTELLDRLSVGAAGGSDAMIAPGGTVGEFTATTVDGEPVSRDLLADTTLVGFFSPSCVSCRQGLGQFVEYARAHPGGRDQALAVVIAHDDSAAAPMIAELADVVRVVRDGDGGPVQKAFGVQGLPAFGLIKSDGVVVASGRDLSTLPVAAVS